MLRTWNVDDHTVIEADVGLFGATVLSVNGTRVPEKLSTRKKSELSFDLPDHRRAVMFARPQFGTRPVLNLSVNGRSMVETGKKPVKCDACGIVVKPNDRFCAGCGHEMPSAETVGHRENLNKATRAISWLAVLFVVTGLLLYFVGTQQADRALTNLAGMADTATYPTPIDGHSYTVGELRKQIVWEPRGTLAVNLILAAVMGALALWSRRAPLPAILIATATYVVLSVANALFDPRTIGQGIWVKIVVIALLFRGIKAALALRSARA